MNRSAMSRIRVALNAVLLLTGAAVAVAATGQQALAGTVPPAPSGWTTVFGTDFAGAAGSALSSANWFYDLGTDSGNKEVNHNTSSTSNVYRDGKGHLVVKAIRSGGSWTAARIESTRDDFQAPRGGEMEMTASLEQPSAADPLGYWPAFWALGSPTRTGGALSSSGELDMMEDVNGLNKAAQFLHTAAGTSSNHPLIPCPAAGSGCQTGYHTYSVIINRTNTKAEYLQVLMDGKVESKVTEAHVGTTVWREAVDHGFFIIFDLAMGGSYPNGLCGCTTPTSATTSGASMSVSYVAVYEKGGNSTPTATPTATGQVKGSGALCLTNKNSLNTEINPVVATTCNGTSGQHWSVYSDGTLRTEGGCLDVMGRNYVGWYPCNGTAAETWTHKSNRELVNPKANLCLTNPDVHTTSRLEIKTCTGTAQQIWTLPSGTGTGRGTKITKNEVSGR
jgi:Ricin-type beta-trefoil lectin domain